MRILFLGNNKVQTLQALSYLLERKHEVAGVVGCEQKSSPQSLEVFAREQSIAVLQEPELYHSIEGQSTAESIGEIDLVVSFLFRKKILPTLIDFPRIAALNFHPAPLPGFRGVGGYNIAICRGLKEWGVTGHFIEKTFDTGPIVAARTFPIDAERETAFSLEKKSLDVMLDLFRNVISLAQSGSPLPRHPQQGGNYYSRKDFEELRRISPKDDLEMIRRKIRAFWYPPLGGAFIELNGQEFTVIDENILEQISKQNLKTQ